MSEKKEYIERGALSKFVRDVRKRLPKDSKDFFTRDEMLLNFQQYVELQPAADVEPVVRCKDCKWYETGVCDFLGAVTLDDDYCSIGARTERSGSGE